MNKISYQNNRIRGEMTFYERSIDEESKALNEKRKAQAVKLLNRKVYPINYSIA